MVAEISIEPTGLKNGLSNFDITMLIYVMKQGKQCHVHAYRPDLSWEVVNNLTHHPSLLVAGISIEPTGF